LFSRRPTAAAREPTARGPWTLMNSIQLSNRFHTEGDLRLISQRAPARTPEPLLPRVRRPWANSCAPDEARARPRVAEVVRLREPELSRVLLQSPPGFNASSALASAFAAHSPPAKVASAIYPAHVPPPCSGPRPAAIDRWPSPESYRARRNGGCLDHSRIPHRKRAYEERNVDQRPPGGRMPHRHR